jgi:hypothetical protein
VITINYSGGLGNQLWQYAVGRVLSQELGLLLLSKKIEGFADCPRIIKGKVKLTPKIELSGHLIPRNLGPQRIVLNGYFERYEYISPYMDQIKKWFTPIVQTQPVPSKALTISIRRGSNNWPVDTLCPSIDYYLEKVFELGFQSHLICTDSPKDEFITDLANRIPNARIVESGPLEQFALIQQSKNILIAPSTFSWWAAMTGEAERIFWPRIPALDFTNSEYDWFPTNCKKLELI